MKKLCVMLCVLGTIYSIAPGAVVSKHSMISSVKPCAANVVTVSKTKTKKDNQYSVGSIKKSYLSRINTAFDIINPKIPYNLQDLLIAVDNWLQNICNTVEISADQVSEIRRVGEELKNARAVVLMEFIKQQDRALVRLER